VNDRRLLTAVIVELQDPLLFTSSSSASTVIAAANSRIGVFGSRPGVRIRDKEKHHDERDVARKTS
jgi:hypothetical protein